jgi:hypothetical protein
MMVRAAPDRFLVRVILSGITRRGTTVSPIAVILGTGDLVLGNGSQDALRSAVV